MQVTAYAQTCGVSPPLLLKSGVRDPDHHEGLPEHGVDGLSREAPEPTDGNAFRPLVRTSRRCQQRPELTPHGEGLGGDPSGHTRPTRLVGYPRLRRVQGADHSTHDRVRTDSGSGRSPRVCGAGRIAPPSVVDVVSTPRLDQLSILWAGDARAGWR